MTSLQPMPMATTISAPFWDALKEGQLQIQQCNACQGWVFFPRNHCSHCLAHDLSWQQVSGEGTLYSYTLARVPTLPEFSGETAQILAVVELTQGARINTNLVGVTEEEISIGMAIKPVFNQVDAEGNTLLQFTRADKSLGNIAYQNPLSKLERNAQDQVLVPVDNLPALHGLVTDEFCPWSPSITVDQGVINAFADLSGDDYWIHTDPVRAAKESPFGTTIAHGALVQILQSRLTLSMPYEIVGFDTMVNYGSNKLRFPTPVPAGSEIHARAKVKSVQSSRKGVQLTLEIHTHIVGNDRPSVINELVILYC